MDEPRPGMTVGQLREVIAKSGLADDDRVFVNDGLNPLTDAEFRHYVMADGVAFECMDTVNRATMMHHLGSEGYNNIRSERILMLFGQREWPDLTGDDDDDEDLTEYPA